MSDFYVGYLPKAPPTLARYLRFVVLGLALLAAGVALMLVVAQTPFAKSTFEYGTVRSFEGTIALGPYPVLFVQRPGKATEQAADSQYLLVAPGKHGAEDLLTPYDRQQVRLKGQLVFRDVGTMVEVAPGSIEVLPRTAASPPTSRDLGPVTVRGEIVDSKCYLGVMNPGSGKVHRDCAARCLSGGIPPIFVATDQDLPAKGNQYLLVGPDGGPLARDAVREFVAEPMTVQAELFQRGDTQLLQIDPHALRHAQ